jgi:PIN domain nuclease of toxin-antitoxin system
MIVLDASAVLALLFREPGHEQVAEVLDQACLSTVNAAEVLERLARGGSHLDDARRMLEHAPWETVDFDLDQAAEAARLAPVTRGLGLSLGDRACLALARRRGVPVLTADRAWLQVDAGVTVRTIR